MTAKKRMSIEMVIDKVECEGFDYFFTSYSSPSSLPKELEELAIIYCHARENLSDALDEYSECFDDDFEEE